jgi:hypothetical protein
MGPGKLGDRTMPDDQDTSIGWDFWFQWVLASTIGVAVLFALIFAVAMLVGAIVGGEAEDKVPFVPFVGLSFGIMQWLILRRYMPRAGWWVLASTLGWILGFGILALADKFAENLVTSAIQPEVSALVFFLAAGALVGILQWLVLRRHMLQAGWWVLANVVGWGILGLIVGKSLDRFTDLAAMAAVPPAITGIVLVWLFRQTFSAASDLGQSAA